MSFNCNLCHVCLRQDKGLCFKCQKFEDKLRRNSGFRLIYNDGRGDYAHRWGNNKIIEQEFGKDGKWLLLSRYCYKVNSLHPELIKKLLKDTIAEIGRPGPPLPVSIVMDYVINEDTNRFETYPIPPVY